MTNVWHLLRGWADKRPGGMTDSQIARALGVDPQLVGKWKKGTTPGPENLRRVAELIGEDYASVVLYAALVDQGFLDADAPSPFPTPSKPPPRQRRGA